LTLPVVFSGASLVLCGFFFIYFSFYIKRRTRRENILSDYQDEAYKLIADIDAATDRDLTLVEERITTLKKLLEDVDKRIAVLSREQERKRSSDAVYTSLGRQMKITIQEPVDEAVSRSSPSEPAPVPAGQKAAPVTTPAIAERKEAQASFTERVAELSRAGFAPDLIAARLGVSISEVKLAIAVSRRKG
jgi:hypothetical protein